MESRFGISGIEIDKEDGKDAGGEDVGIGEETEIVKRKVTSKSNERILREGEVKSNWEKC